MICPRCGTQAGPDQERCARCTAALIAPAPVDVEPLAVLAAPTRRGELRQAAEGTVTVSFVGLARAKAAAAAPPPAVPQPVAAPQAWPTPPAPQGYPVGPQPYGSAGATAPGPPAAGYPSGAPPAGYPGGSPPAPYPTGPPPAPYPSGSHQGQYPSGPQSGPYPSGPHGGHYPSGSHQGQYPSGPTGGYPGEYGVPPAQGAPPRSAGPTWAPPEHDPRWPPPPAPPGPWPPPPRPDAPSGATGEWASSPPSASATRSSLRARSDVTSPAGAPPGDQRGPAASATAAWGAPVAGHLPPSYWWQAWVALVIPPVGLVALYFSLQVGKRAAVGDSVGAVRASRLTRTCCLLAAAVGTLALLVAVGVDPK